MNHRILPWLAVMLASAVAAVTGSQPVVPNAEAAGPSGPSTHEGLHVLPPITHGNLTIFPVVGGTPFAPTLRN